MRIRKHAKVSPLVYAASSLKPGALLQPTSICQLNQSPWDVITFSSADYDAAAAAASSLSLPPPPPPPPSYQVDGDCSFLGNGSFCDSIGDDESVASMKFSWDDEDKEFETPKWAYPDDNGGFKAAVEGVQSGKMKGSVAAEQQEEEAPVGLKKKNDEEEVFCSNIDGKGWQCHRLAKNGHSFCEHHLKKHNSHHYSAAQPISTPKESGSSWEHHHQRRRPRPKKSSGGSADPNAYYYYSGFGPRWGRKRGGQGRGGGEEHSNNNINFHGSSSTSTDETIIRNNVEENKIMGEASTSMGNGVFDYVEEEDDDDEDDGGGSGKKRARKPVKARSLKSLM